MAAFVARLLLEVTGLHGPNLRQLFHSKVMRGGEKFGSHPVTANTSWKGWEPLTQFYVCPVNYPQEKFTLRTSSFFFFFPELELLG